MTASIAPVKHRWETREYATMTSAYRQGELLLVSFLDGDTAAVPLKALSGYGVADTDWSALLVTEDEIVVPRRSARAEIPWDVIRCLTDPEFDAAMEVASVVAAARAGARLRELREARGVGQRELAERVGVAVEEVARLESGQARAEFELQDEILDALGCTDDDLFPIEER